MKRFVPFRLLAVLLAMWGSTASFAQAPAPLGDEVRLSEPSTFDSFNTSAAPSSNGSFVVVWNSYGSNGSDDDLGSIQGRRFGATGLAVGNQFQVNTYTTGRQLQAAVATLENDDFVVVWTSAGSSGSDSDNRSVQGRRFSAVGEPRGDQFQVNSYTMGGQSSARVAGLAEGGFVVVWESQGSNGPDQSADSVQGQRFNADGEPIGGQFQINTETQGNQSFPAIAAQPDGNFVVAWKGDRPFAQKVIDARRFAADGSPLGDPFRVNSLQISLPTRPEVAVSDNGSFVIVWGTGFGGNPGDDVNWTIQSQRFAPDASPRGEQLRVNALATGFQADPVVTTLTNGGFVVSWASVQAPVPDASSHSVQAQRLSADGRLLGPQFQVNTFTTGPQRRPTLSRLPNGEFMILWESQGSAGSEGSTFSIQGQRYASSLCASGPSRLCLTDDRFAVEVEWMQFDGETGSGQVLPFRSADSGLFWFFSENNWEMLVKVLDGCAINERFWVFSAATTDVAYTLKVTDTETGQIREFTNPLGVASSAVTDTDAFATCY